MEHDPDGLSLLPPPTEPDDRGAGPAAILRAGFATLTRSPAALAAAALMILAVAVAVTASEMNPDRRGQRAAFPEPCPASLPRALVDAELGMALCLPANWREVHADDAETWLELYGDRESDAERWIRDGTMDHFAVPLAPRDADSLVNLAIYSHPVKPGTSLAELTAAYVRVLETEGDVDVTNTVELEAGPAVLIEDERLRSTEGRLVVDRGLDWIVVHDERAFYVLLVSDRTFADEYRSTFEAVANSVHFREKPAE